MRGQKINRRIMIKNGGLNIDQANIRTNSMKLAISKNTTLELRITH